MPRSEQKTEAVVALTKDVSTILPLKRAFGQRLVFCWPRWPARLESEMCAELI